MKQKMMLLLLVLLALSLTGTLAFAIPGDPGAPPEGPTVGNTPLPPDPTPTPTEIPPTTVPETLKDAVVCKFISIDSTAAIGNPITATGKGITSYIRLESNGAYFKLPVIPGTQSLTTEGNWQAQYYTIDPTTNQPLVNIGTYKISCFGEGGTASSNTQTITIIR